MNIHYNPGPKMADVLTVLTQDKTTTPVNRRDMISALNSLERLSGKSLSDIPAAVPQLREAFEGVYPLARDITPKTLSNIKSLCLKAIRTSELVPGVIQNLTKGRPKTAEWAELWSALTKPSERNSLTRLATWCNVEKIPPKEVNSDVIELMMEHMNQNSLRPDQYLVHRATAKTWNLLVDRLPEMKLSKVNVPVSRSRRSQISLDKIPKSFTEDWDRFAAWAHGEDMFADEGRAVRLKQSTIDNYFRRAHLCITLLVETGIDPITIRSIGDLTTVDAFKRIMRKRIEKSDGEIGGETFFLARFIIQLAEQWVHVDTAVLTDLKGLAKRIPQPAFEMSQKNKLLVMKFDDPDILSRLLETPKLIWDEVEANTKNNRRRLAQAQAALAIDILTSMPIRLQNLADLKFEEHLFLQPGGSSSLVIPKEAMKSGNGVEFDIPPAVAERMIAYRHTIAPAVMGKRSDYLFCKVDGSQKGFASVRYLIERYVKQYVGFHMNPHAFRHLAAKLILDTNPGGHVVAQHLLGHKKVETTAKFYAGIDTRRAGRHHQTLLEQSLKSTDASQAALRDTVRRGAGRRT